MSENESRPEVSGDVETGQDFLDRDVGVDAGVDIGVDRDYKRDGEGEVEGEMREPEYASRYEQELSQAPDALVCIQEPVLETELGDMITSDFADLEGNCEGGELTVK